MSYAGCYIAYRLCYTAYITSRQAGLTSARLDVPNAVYSSCTTQLNLVLLQPASIYNARRVTGRIASNNTSHVETLPQYFKYFIY